MGVVRWRQANALAPRWCNGYLQRTRHHALRSNDHFLTAVWKFIRYAKEKVWKIVFGHFDDRGTCLRNAEGCERVQVEQVEGAQLHHPGNHDTKYERDGGEIWSWARDALHPNHFMGRIIWSPISLLATGLLLLQRNAWVEDQCCQYDHNLQSKSWFRPTLAVLRAVAHLLFELWH